MNKMNTEKFLILLYGVSSLVILLILLPIIALYLMGDPETFCKVLFQDPMLSKESWSALFLTFEISILSTVTLLVIGIPVGYVLARFEFKGKNILEAIVDIPLLTPHIIAGIMVISAFGRGGIINKVLMGQYLSVEDNVLGILLAMMFVSIPIMIDTIKVGFASIDRNLELVARSLGVSLHRVFLSITLPLSVRNIVAGCILSWARAVSEIGAILVVAYFPKTINVLIYEWYTTYGLKYAVTLSILLLSIFIVIFASIRVIYRR